jgi:hypothetical protein
MRTERVGTESMQVLSDSKHGGGRKMRKDEEEEREEDLQ